MVEGAIPKHPRCSWFGIDSCSEPSGIDSCSELSGMMFREEW